MAPNMRAFHLLSLARDYLRGGDPTVADARLTPVLNQPQHWLSPRVWENTLVYWAEQASLAGHATTNGRGFKTEAESDSQSIDGNQAFLADAAIRSSLKQLDKGSSDEFTRLNMYFIASRLFQKVRNADGMRKCNKVLERVFQSCEGSSSPNEESIKAAVSVLNSMAYGFIPYQIPDRLPQFERQLEIKPFSEQDFRECEKLKLRALAMAERLPPTNQLRRKAHRDLALWYMHFGKREMAEKEKQVLFELVGTNDDRILYPQMVACGRLVWWETETRIVSSDCGMG
jgi:hypothetical protein